MAIQGLKTSHDSFEAGSKKAKKTKKTGFYIGVSCPGCGSKLELEDDFSVLVCDHCESVLRVLMPESPPAYLARPKATEREIRFCLDRHLKNNDLPLSNSSLTFKRLLYPYWKTDAILLKVRNRVYEKVIGQDTEYSKAQVLKQEKREIALSPYSHSGPAAQPIDGLPVSMGLRGEYLEVLPFATENIPDNFTPLPIVTDWPQALAAVEKSVGHMNSLSAPGFGRNLTELFHPRGSVVYFPYLIAECYGNDNFQRFIIDGVTGKIVNHVSRPPALDNSDDHTPIDLSFGELDIAFHRCEECGDDLKPERTFVCICANCQHTNFCGEKPDRFDGVHLADIEPGKDTEFFPFWSFNLPKNSSREISRLFGGIFKSDWLTIPAFRNKHFESMYRLSKRITAALPEINLTTELPVTTASFLPVSVSHGEAQTLARVVIQRRRLKDSSTLKRDIGFDPKALDCRLIYIPFKPEHYFCVDAVIGSVTFEKSSIA